MKLDGALGACKNYKEECNYTAEVRSGAQLRRQCFRGNLLPPLEYPDRFQVRYVSYDGIQWNKGSAGDYVGLEEIVDGLARRYSAGL